MLQQLGWVHYTHLVAYTSDHKAMIYAGLAPINVCRVFCLAYECLYQHYTQMIRILHPTKLSRNSLSSRHTMNAINHI
jgi:hypothetical protein